MKVYRSLSEIVTFDRKATLAIGTFDGIHRGHKMLLSRAKDISVNSDSNLIVFTFSNIPSHTDEANISKTILQYKDKVNIMRDLGVDVLIYTEFTDKIKNIDRVCFINYLKKELNISSMVIGEDFRFGKNAEGNAEWLKQNEKEFDIIVELVPFLNYNGKKISSTLIRSRLEKGFVEDVNKMLGRPYSIEGVVKNGEKLGRSIGYRTANINPETKQRLPQHAVYITRTIFCGRTYNSVSNVGVKPTVGGNELSIETHVLDFDDNLYNREIKIEFLKKIREEEKFSTIDELKIRISKDVEIAREYFSKKEDKVI